MNKEMHLVLLATGSYDDYTENVIFVTNNKEKALLWVEKHNRLIKENDDRLRDYVFKEGQQKDPFWYDYIVYYEPVAILRTVEYRD